MMATKLDTKSTIHIGDGLELPLDWMTMGTVVYGAPGSGKTCFGRVVAEELHRAGQRFCAIDVKGDWWGLKSSASGKSDGIPVVVFGGDHQDLPLEEGAGAFVAETVATIGASCILDFENFSKGKQLAFMTKFFETLYDKNRSPLLLMLDEAQRYAPQTIKQKGFEATRCLGAVEDLVKLGRKHGLGKMLFTQRGASLNKEVSELCELLVAFRSPGPRDQKRIEEWIEANVDTGEVKTKFSSLPTGNAFFASGHPNLRALGVYGVRRPWTFDSSATPKIGQHKIEPKKLAKVDLDELRVKMSDAIERVKQDDPKELRKTIGELRAELAKKTIAVVPAAPAPAKVKVERLEVKVPILKGKESKELGRALEGAKKVLERSTKIVAGTAAAASAFEAIATSLRKEIATVEGVAQKIERAIADAKNLATPASAPPAPAARVTAVPVVARPKAPPAFKPPAPPEKWTETATLGQTKSISDTGLARIMVAVISSDRGEGVSRGELVLVTGFARSTVNRYLTSCTSNGWITTSSQTAPVFVTDLGRQTFKDAPAPLEGDARRLQWIAKFGESTGEGRIIVFLSQFGEQWIERAEIDGPVNIASSSRNRYLSTLGGPSYRIVETNGSKVRLSPLLFSKS